jgi:hypothetical protein
MISVPPSVPPTTSPRAVTDLAASCVRFVKAALGFELDFERDTLPVLDGYLGGARAAVRERPETLPLVAAAIGAYLGEVVRRYHRCWWRVDSDEPLGWQLEFRDVYLSFRPVELAHAALLLHPDEPAVVDEPGDEDEPDDGVHAGHPPVATGEARPGADETEGSDPDATDEAESAVAEERAAREPFASDGPDEPGLVLEEADRLAVRARLDRLPPVTEEEYWAPSTRLEVIDIVVDAIQAQYLVDPDRRHEFGPDDYDD